MHCTLSCSYGEKFGFAIKICQNPAPVGFGKSKSRTTLISHLVFIGPITKGDLYPVIPV